MTDYLKSFDRDKYPLTNVRWTYALAFFILPLAFVGSQDGNIKTALAGAAFGLIVVTYISLLFLGIDTDSRLSDLTMALTVAVLLTIAIAALVAAGVFILEHTPVFTLPTISILVFTLFFYTKIRSASF